MGHRFVAFAAICFIFFSACKIASSQKPQSVIATTKENRKILGEAKQFKVDENVSEKELNTSMSKRRAYGWDLLDRVLEPVNVQGYSIPVWQTWYDVQEFQSIMEHILFNKLTKQERKDFFDKSKPFPKFDSDFILQAMKEHDNKALDPIYREAYQKRLEEIRSVEDVRSLGGISESYSVYSPDLIQFALENARTLVFCSSNYAMPHSPEQCQKAPPELDDFGRCFGGEFPKGAVSIKTKWRSANKTLMHNETHAKALARVMRIPRDNGDEEAVQKGPVWKGTLEVMPNAENIFRSRQVHNGEYRTDNLIGFHILSKEIPRWTWASYWWVPPSLRDDDFGADRPDAQHIKGVWKNYKMCVASDYEEQDQELLASIEGMKDEDFASSDDKSLDFTMKAQAHFANHSPSGVKSTFCSNPYIEFNHGWAQTNCLGCHQHAELLKPPTAEHPTKPITSQGMNNPPSCQQRSDYDGEFLWTIRDFQIAVGSAYGSTPKILKTTLSSCAKAGCHDAITKQNGVMLENMAGIEQHKHKILCRIGSSDDEVVMPRRNRWPEYKIDLNKKRLIALGATLEGLDPVTCQPITQPL